MMEIEKVVKLTSEYIKTLCSPERSESLLKIIESLDEVYFTAPASGKNSYHSSYDGGLAVHNLNVLRNLVLLNEAFELGLSDESVCVVAFLHDIGKVVNSDNQPYYTPTEMRWKRERGENYDVNPGSVYFPTHQRSMWLLQKFGFTLNAEEYQAILLNDGQYLNENKAYAMRECTLARALHMADMLSLIKETREQNND